MMRQQVLLGSDTAKLGLCRQGYGASPGARLFGSPARYSTRNRRKRWLNVSET